MGTFPDPFIHHTGVLCARDDLTSADSFIRTNAPLAQHHSVLLSAQRTRLWGGWSGKGFRLYISQCSVRLTVFNHSGHGSGHRASLAQCWTVDWSLRSQWRVKGEFDVLVKVRRCSGRFGLFSAVSVYWLNLNDSDYKLVKQTNADGGPPKYLMIQ